MLQYCKNDVHLTGLLYKRLWKEVGGWKQAIALEHKVAIALRDATNHGFYFDVNKAIDMKIELEKERDKYDKLLYEAVPYIIKEEVFIPKKDNINKGYIKSVPFIKRKQIEFNPNSSKQCIEEILEPAGWLPTDRTDGHKEFLETRLPKDCTEEEKENYNKKKERYKRLGWKLNETNLSTLPEEAPQAAKSILKRTIYETRIRKLTEWLDLVQDDNRVHGRIVGLGTWTHRMVHNSPNLANIAAHKSIKYHTEELNSLATDLGGRMRELWMAAPGKVLVGTDAEGIQLRVLAHYMEDEEFTKAVTEGNKNEGTDPHSFNQKQIGLGTRDNAKTFIYAFLLGAGDTKIGEIYSISSRAGRELKERFIESTPGLKNLKRKRIPTEARRGFTIGFDGRRIYCNSEHLMMAAYLQGGEAIIMKLALIIALRKLKESHTEAQLINVVHDEMIFECSPEVSKTVLKATEESIKEAGERLGLKCPMKGEGKIGMNWLNVH